MTKAVYTCVKGRGNAAISAFRAARAGPAGPAVGEHLGIDLAQFGDRLVDVAALALQQIDLVDTFAAADRQNFRAPVRRRASNSRISLNVKPRRLPWRMSARRLRSAWLKTLAARRRRGGRASLCFHKIAAPGASHPVSRASSPIVSPSHTAGAPAESLLPAGRSIPLSARVRSLLAIAAKLKFRYPESGKF